MCGCWVQKNTIEYAHVRGGAWGVASAGLAWCAVHAKDTRCDQGIKIRSGQGCTKSTGSNAYQYQYVAHEIVGSCSLQKRRVARCYTRDSNMKDGHYTDQAALSRWSYLFPFIILEQFLTNPPSRMFAPALPSSGPIALFFFFFFFEFFFFFFFPAAPFESEVFFFFSFFFFFPSFFSQVKLNQHRKRTLSGATHRQLSGATHR